MRTFDARLARLARSRAAERGTCHGTCDSFLDDRQVARFGYIIGTRSSTPFRRSLHHVRGATDCRRRRGVESQAPEMCQHQDTPLAHAWLAVGGNDGRLMATAGWKSRQMPTATPPEPEPLTTSPPADQTQFGPRPA